MPDWLPEMFCVDPWGHSTYDELYRVFCADIKNARLQYAGQRVWFFPDKDDGKEVLFWHLTTRDQRKTVVPRRKRKFQRKGTLRKKNNGATS